MKRWSICSVLPLLVIAGAEAQCGMVTMISATPGCFISTLSVNTTGGTPPYSIAIVVYSAGSPMPFSPIMGDMDGDYSSSYDASGVAYMTVTVTDANACVATDQETTDIWMYPGFTALPSLPDPCTGGGQIRFRLSSPASGFSSLCPLASHNLFVDNVNVGPLQNACVSEGGDHFHTIASYAPGNHDIRCANLNCVGGLHECWLSTTATVSPTASGDCDVNINVRAMLGGAAQSGQIMEDGLRVANVIPLTEPYTALGYGFVGAAPGATMPASLLLVNTFDAVVDWVVVELRNSNAPAQIVYSKAALIQRDGDVMDADGSPSVSFPVPDGNYFVAIRHRNHLGVMTSTAQNLASAPGWVDLTSAYTTCYGTNARMSNGTVQGLWSGETTGDGSVRYTGANNDRDPVLTAIGGTTPNNTFGPVYDRRDVNLDGVIKYTGAGNDRDAILLTVGSTTPNGVRVQQLP